MIETVADAHPGTVPFAGRVDRENRRLVEGTGQKSAGGVAQVMLGKVNLGMIRQPQLALQRREQRPHPIGAEFPGLVVGDLPQLPEAGHVGFEMADRAGQV